MNIKKYFNWKIVIGLIATIIGIVLGDIHFTTIKDLICLDDPYCHYSLPVWLVFSIAPFIILGLVVLIWGILEKILQRIGKSKKVLNIVAIIVLILFVIYLGFSIWLTYYRIQSMLPSDNYSKIDSGIYSNGEYGFEFQIPFEGPVENSKKCSVEQDGNKFTICGENGQSVEIFRDSISQSLKQAIEERFLKDSPPEMCWVEQEKNNEDGWIYAHIDYPMETDPEKSPWENRKFCSDYSKTNGVLYFAMDPHYPYRFAFFRIGQDALFSANKETWQSTFR
ncbi:MAG: hypothetical protein U9Q16_02520, partial [Patescibacteria group bacterium]|nr:hypothetical protein [Patescibacteria group bacterium]